MKNHAEALPFDILCSIFEEYAEEDCRSEPLETILLVCKSWFSAALNHQKLWCTFDICLETKDVVYWTSCLRRRLARCSIDALLDIEVTRYINSPIKDDPEAYAAYEEFFHTLVGEYGEVARRWRRFSIDSTFKYLQNATVARGLSFPTPNLEEFNIETLRGDFTILPEAPSLKVLQISGVKISMFPDLGNVVDLQIDVGITPFDEIDETTIAHAVSMVSLNIRSWPPFRLAANYPQLCTLRIEGTISEDCLKAFSAPALKELTLAVDRGRDYLHIASCPGIDLKKLKRASIGWPHRIEDDTVAEYLDGVRQFLVAAVGLDTLEIENKYMASLVLKLLTDDCERLYQSRSVVLVLDEEEMELGRGENRLSSVNRFREITGCMPDSSWDDIFGSLAGALLF